MAKRQVNINIIHPPPVYVTVLERKAITLKRENVLTWHDKCSLYWLIGLLEEVFELTRSLIGLHKHTPESKLLQIAAITMNWAELIAIRRSIKLYKPGSSTCTVERSEE
jgi:hypothetical protein